MSVILDQIFQHYEKSSTKYSLPKTQKFYNLLEVSFYINTMYPKNKSSNKYDKL